jgi:hypothetical protein
MKRILLMALLVSNSAIAQKTERTTDMNLYAILGGKQVSISSSLNSAKPRSVATSIGAGVTWTKNKKLQFGTEFFYSTCACNAKTSTAEYAGFSSNIFIGYAFYTKQRLSISPLVGVGTARNTVIFSSKENGNSIVFSNKPAPLVHTALAVHAYTKNGLTIGVKAGYNFSPSGKSEWMLKGPGTGAGVADNAGGFFFQITSGGLLTLNKK